MNPCLSSKAVKFRINSVLPSLEYSLYPQLFKKKKTMQIGISRILKSEIFLKSSVYLETILIILTVWNSATLFCANKHSKFRPNNWYLYVDSGKFSLQNWKLHLKLSLTVSSESESVWYYQNLFIQLMALLCQFSICQSPCHKNIRLDGKNLK